MLHARFEGTAWRMNDTLGLCISNDIYNLSKGAKSYEKIIETT